MLEAGSVLDLPQIGEERIAERRNRYGAESKPSFRLIDLFCGAGGLTLGFTEAFGHCFQSVWANDSDPDAAATYNANFGDHSLFGERCVVGDIERLAADPTVYIPKADVVIGGPPCQGFSLLNRERARDSRKQLWRPFLAVVERSEAQVFVMENVPQLLGSPEQEQILRAAEQMGFRLAWDKLCAADYGVPQLRWRAFIIGSRHSDPAMVFPPPKTHFPPNSPEASA